MRVSIFGIGYVGLVQAAALAEAGNDVIAVDTDAKKIARLLNGQVPIYEPGLERVVHANVAEGRLHFTTDAAEGVAFGSLIFIAVGTPADPDGSADLKHVLSVADTIGTHIDRAATVVVKSTVPVGTTEKVKEHIAAKLAERGRSALAFDVASNPEFLKEGSALADFQKPDRIVIGVENGRAEAVLRELYRPFNRNSEKIVVMDVRSAELTKYAANSMLATKISFMNEIANLADRLGADIERVRLGIGADPRIGYQFLYSGVGYGGACFPKDVRALVRTAEQLDFDAKILKSVEARNEAQKELMFSKIKAYFGDSLGGRVFALWGLAFKPNTNDMREAPSRVLMEALWEAGATVRAYDPKASEECRDIYQERDDLTLVDTKDAAMEGADALIVMTEWRAFQSPDFEIIAKTLKEPVIFDGRNIYDPAIAERYGLELIGIGRQSVPKPG